MSISGVEEEATIATEITLDSDSNEASNATANIEQSFR